MASKTKTGPPKDHIPEIIHDLRNNVHYTRGKFMGKGGFAKCYELVDSATKRVFAGKIVSKSLLMKQSQKDKMTQEVAIHRSLDHANIVKFYTFFEDDDNVYITLELCRRRSLMEMHKRRKAFTEPEARYFLKQITTACKYLHDNRIIHRDLKLGNLFLNDDMEVKIGDFGLATRVEFDGERKRTLCGTPNYIAPEVLNKKGHSYEVDVWSLGCILYTLLLGKPPFETSSLKDTYLRIRKNEYSIPAKLSFSAKNLIQKLLQADPSKRPTMGMVLKDPFMTSGYMPSRLPTSCLTMAPRFDQRADFSLCVTSRQPLLEMNEKEEKKDVVHSTVKREKLGGGGLSPRGNAAVVWKSTAEGPATTATAPEGPEDSNCNNFLKDLAEQLSSVIACKPHEKEVVAEDEAESPSAAPMIWFSKWVDYSDKYGLGYQLCDNSVGVLYNDATKLILMADGESLHYIQRDGTENYHTINQYPPELNKKVTLINYFRNYMNDNLLKAGATMVPRDGDELVRVPYLLTWFRTRSAIVLYLTNGTLQINFFQDHSKIILCPVMNAVTYIDERRDFRTYRLKEIEKYGCSVELFNRLRYARTMVEKLNTRPVIASKK